MRGSDELGSGEKQGDQIPLTKLDYQMIPHLWREPDIIRPGDEPGDIVIEKTISGRTVASAWTISEQKKRLLLKTIYRKKK